VLACAFPVATETSAQTKPATRTASTQSATKPKPKPAVSQSAARRRRARAAAARAEAAAKALREAQEPHFKFDESGALVPDVRAEAAIIYNPENGKVLWETNSQDQRSIASITKVMTAVVFLEEEPNLSHRVVIQSSDVSRASTTYLKRGESVTKEDLLHLLLIASDNAAARALARTSRNGAQGFVERMNAKAQELGLTNTKYSEPSGLLATNVSSAYDMARLITYVSGDNRIAGVMQKQEYRVTAGRRTITIRSTNHLVRESEYQVQAGKTGFISKAGYCLATLLRLPQTGQQVAVVVLGARSSVGRVWETKHLFNWVSAKAAELFGGTPVEAAQAK
jgi:D-alanyl-D-alanine endopeptidase (penicillin-binding protein 7)